MKFSKELLIKLVEDALEIDTGVINENSISKEIEAWDSLGHLNILIALDTKCNGKAGSINELATASSIKEIIEILKSNSLLE